MKKQTKILVGLVGVFIGLLLWWSYFMFCLPHFHLDKQGNFVSGNTVLVRDKSGIMVPNNYKLYFWNSIGVVDGEWAGRLWKYTDEGKAYVIYVPNTEMPPRWVYKYSNK